MKRVICNVCGEPLPPKDLTAFLCTSCNRFAPLPAMLRYRRACNAVRAFRRATDGIPKQVPEHLTLELAASWRACADAAREAYYWEAA